MILSNLHNTLVEKFIKRNGFTHFCNEGLEFNVFYNGSNNIDLLNEAKSFVEALGFKTKETGRKYKKLIISC